MENKFLSTDNTSSFSREKIEEKYKWKLEDIYAGEEDWENDFKWIETNYENIKKFEGKLSDNGETIFECLEYNDSISIKIDRIFLYAMLSKDIDLSNNKNLARYDRVISLFSRYNTARAFINPEIIKIGEEKISDWLKTNENLKIYSHFFSDLFRSQKHILIKELEEVLALASPILENPHSTFSVFDNADINYPVIKDTEGKDYQISHGRYTAALYSTNREFRKNVYKGFYEPYNNMKNTLASLLNGQLNSLLFRTRARKYSSNLESSLDSNNIPSVVYHNLINTVKTNLKTLHRWAEIKTKYLKYDKLHPYDTYVTLFPSVNKEYTYEEGINLLYNSIKPLGEQYCNDVRKAVENRWIDVFETKGKRSGAYSSGTTYGVHPYILLNWNNKLNDVFTLAHEVGHNMHSLYTGNYQPYVYANYSIFVAEVASTTNEALLLDYLIKNARSREEKLALIEMNLTNIQTTFFRQTRFAEFELLINRMTEEGEPVTAENLTEKFGELYKEYWGNSMEMDEEEALCWARIPHFYYNFYVYQYATSYAASQTITEKIINGEEGIVEKYLAFLKAGSSSYPVDILKNTGIDMTTGFPVESVIRRMDMLLDELTNLI